MKVIITGASGMVGEGVLHECLLSPEIEKVLVVGRKACGHTDEKMEELLVPDLANLSEINEQLAGYDACFFCAGVSSVGMKKDLYRHITYDLTISFARTLLGLNSDMVFIYVSGAGTDGTEKGRLAWARVKGKTENDLLAMGFKDAYMFRPGMIHPTRGLKNTLKAYKYLGFLYPVFQLLTPANVTSQREVGQAMINCVKTGDGKKVLDSRDINRLAVT